jgi:hypothetical protein
MDLKRIPEFLNLTKLSEKDIITMLDNGELSVATGPMGELLIDISDVSPETIARRQVARPTEINKDAVALLEEMIASEVVHAVQSMSEEAFELSIRWAKNRKKK